MNVLFGIFLAGTAAVVFPFVFHLIRQTPKGQQEFSSLMFLQPTPPRLTRRSRLDDILLLILRGLVIVLLAVAFTRPFWRAVADISLTNVRGRRVLILVDTSASMRRGNLWSQAVEQVDEVLDDLEPSDDVALFVFDRDAKAIVNFNSPDEEESTDKAALVRNLLKQQSPTWNPTDLGNALIRTAEILDETIDREESDDALQIVVISDMQRGAELNALQVYEWPEDVRVSIKPVAPQNPSNAHLERLLTGENEPPDTEPRVRVTNAEDSTVEQFQVNWVGDTTRPGDDAVTFYVPPNQNRSLPVPRTPEDMKANRLVLTGDAAEFDNQYFVVPVRQEELRLAYLGNEAPKDANQPLLYLSEALVETPKRKVKFSQFETGKSPPMLNGDLPHLVVISRSISEPERSRIQEFLKSGGQALVLLADQKMAESLGDLLEGATVDPIQTASASDYRMLGQIDFSHPIFAPFASPRYNDFTGIRFWNYRPVTLPSETSARVIARFDNDKPALWEQPHGKGKLYVLSSGWQPEESQLAVSNKFVPMLEELIEECAPKRFQSTSYLVGDRVMLPEISSSEKRVVIRPDGGEFLIPSEASSFNATEEPGIYTLKTPQGDRSFAVNLASSESNTHPMETVELEQLHVQLGTQATQQEEYERLRQLRDRELESKQKMWKWLVLAALVVVGAETWLAGKRSRRTPEATGEQI